MPSKYYKNYYEILELEQNATLKEIKSRFRELAKQYHPDTGKVRNSELFKEFAEAYDVLSDPVKRVEYDREFFGIAGSRKQARPAACNAPGWHHTGADSINAKRTEGQGFYTWEGARDRISDPGGHPHTNKIGNDPEPTRAASVEKNNLVQEERRLRQQVRLPGNQVAAKMSLAQLLLNCNRGPLEAERLLQDVLRDNPRNIETVYWLGVAKCHQGDHTEAEKAFRLGLQMTTAHAGCTVCVACLEWRRDGTINILNRLSGIRPGTDGAYRQYALVGDFLHGHRNYNQAIISLREAVRANPSSARSHMLLANCLWAIGRRPEAMEHFKEAVALEPNNLSIRVNMALHQSPSGNINLGGITVRSPDDIEITDRYIRVPYNRNALVAIELKKNDVLQADIGVLEGSDINILVMAEGEFRKYSKKIPFRYYQDGTRLNTRHVTFAMNVQNSGSVCLVIENSGFSTGGAEPDILNCGGQVVTHLQLVVAIPGSSAKPLGETISLGAMPRGEITSSFERILPAMPQTRKRRVRIQAV